MIENFRLFHMQMQFYVTENWAFAKLLQGEDTQKLVLQRWHVDREKEIH